MHTIYCVLEAFEEEPLGYITYVFKSLDSEQKSLIETNYLMCVRFPNWDHKKLNLGDKGFLKFKEIKGGVDKWFDGKQMNYYNSDNIQFIKFVSKPITATSEIIAD